METPKEDVRQQSTEERDGKPLANHIRAMVVLVEGCWVYLHPNWIDTYLQAKREAQGLRKSLEDRPREAVDLGQYGSDIQRTNKG